MRLDRLEGINPEERADLLTRFRGLRKRYYAPGSEAPQSQEEKTRLTSLMESLRTEYAERIPRVPVSRCPFCNEILKRAFDPYGLDGFWWHSVSPVRFAQPLACKHFAVLLGALHLHNRKPEEVETMVQPGPEVPFVVPRLLELDRMVAVVNSLGLATGDTAYPIAYFAETVPPASELHQPWPKRSYQIVDSEGKPQGWSVKVDPWDFELEPWIEKGKVAWIDPDDEALRLKRKGDGSCPYVNLPGIRQPQRIQNQRRAVLPLPTGGDAEPFE